MSTARKRAARSPRAQRCSRCDDQTSHCHGLLIEHRDGTFECTGDEACDAVEERHEAIEPCTEHDPSCRCLP